MPRILSFVGRSNSGKTTLIEKLIPELKARGYKIGIIKHSGHRFDFDKEGKDTWRHRQAGADTVIAAGPGEMALVKNTSYQSIEELAVYCRDMDVIIAEGFKEGEQPRIEVYRKNQPEKPLFSEDLSVNAIVTDASAEELKKIQSLMPMAPDIPFFGLEDIKKIADFIENRFFMY